MPDLRQIQELAAELARDDFPLRLKSGVYDGAKSVGKKLWRGWLQVAASGFGKGLIITALAAITVGAAMFGFQAYAGVAQVGTALGAAVAPTVEQGIIAGASAAIGFLASGWGAVTLAVGGLLGAVSETRLTQNKITAEVAQAQALQYELARTMQGKEITRQTAITDLPATAECNHCEREMQRRAAQTIQNAKSTTANYL